MRKARIKPNPLFLVPEAGIEPACAFLARGILSPQQHQRLCGAIGGYRRLTFLSSYVFVKICLSFERHLASRFPIPPHRSCTKPLQSVARRAR
jgi:hypothetical protein